MLLGAVAIYFTHKRAYDKGITTAVLLHRNGRLKYKDYYDDNGYYQQKERTKKERRTY